MCVCERKKTTIFNFEFSHQFPSYSPTLPRPAHTHNSKLTTHTSTFTSTSTHPRPLLSMSENSKPASDSAAASASVGATTSSSPKPSLSKWANRYRGATVEDLDPPSALSCHPTDPISSALLSAFERDYTHLTVISPENRALLGYLSIPHLRILLETGKVQETDEVSKAMVRFKRKARVYKVITMDTPLEELELFFSGEEDGGSKQEFAVVTDERRRFVLGVATRSDLEEFARRRPA
ncbi:Cystathionine beta-synthase 2 [Phlyctema vagabunda]|uniref:Cystathionine beta-synthase 2 n=1 Tax=Phlyctema vagabunda TaxID=108571 RepID=A0ABR4P6S2_9HELO